MTVHFMSRGKVFPMGVVQFAAGVGAGFTLGTVSGPGTLADLFGVPRRMEWALVAEMIRNLFGLKELDGNDLQLAVADWYSLHLESLIKFGQGAHGRRRAVPAVGDACELATLNGWIPSVVLGVREVDGLVLITFRSQAPEHEGATYNPTYGLSDEGSAWRYPPSEMGSENPGPKTT